MDHDNSNKFFIETFMVLLEYEVLRKNKIEGTPILKLAMVKRLEVKKNLQKIKIRQKICQNILKKYPSKKIIKKN